MFGEVLRINKLIRIKDRHSGQIGTSSQQISQQSIDRVIRSRLFTISV